MAYLVHYKDPDDGMQVKATVINKGFACKPEELHDEMATHLGLKSDRRFKPAGHLITKTAMYEREEVAQMFADNHNGIDFPDEVPGGPPTPKM